MFTVLSLFCAAPVPPPLARLEEHHLVGVWDYAWGQQAEGEIVLGANGCYTSRHSPREDGCYTHIGFWELSDHGRTLTLRETCVSPGWWLNGLVAYTVELDIRAYPTVRGRCGETAVMLSNPRRGGQ